MPLPLPTLSEPHAVYDLYDVIDFFLYSSRLPLLGATFTTAPANIDRHKAEDRQSDKYFLHFPFDNYLVKLKGYIDPFLQFNGLFLKNKKKLGQLILKGGTQFQGRLSDANPSASQLFCYVPAALGRH